MRWGAAFALLWWGVSPHLAFGQARADREQPLVLVGEYDGIIHPIAAEFVDDLVSRADREAAVASVLVLRTPGGLLDSTRTIVSRIIAARAPVVVYVGPSGARAASAGFLVTIAATLATYLKAQPSLRIANPDLAAQQFLGMVLAQNQLGLLLAGKPAAKSKAALEDSIDHAVALFLNGCRKPASGSVRP